MTYGVFPQNRAPLPILDSQDENVKLLQGGNFTTLLLEALVLILIVLTMKPLSGFEF